MADSWIVSYGFADREGRRARTRVGFPVASYTYEQAAAAAALLAGAVQGVSDGVLTDYTITRTYFTPSTGGTPLSSDVTRLGVFVVSLANDNYTLFLLPSLVRDVLLPWSDSGDPFLVVLGDARVLGLRQQLRLATDEYSTPITDIVIGGIAV